MFVRWGGGVSIRGGNTLSFEDGSEDVAGNEEIV